MKIKAVIIAILLVGFISCKNDASKMSILEDATQWNLFVDNMKKEIGDNGGYSSIAYREKEKGTEFIVQLATDTNTTKWQEYNYNNNNFSHIRPIVFEGAKDVLPHEFLYKPYQYDLKRIPQLVEKAKAKLKSEKNVTDTRAILFQVGVPVVRTQEFEDEFGVTIWLKSISTKQIYSFGYTLHDSCGMAELPLNFKF